MQKYVIRRLLLAIPVLLLSSVIVFGLMRVMPGDALIALMGESGNVGEKELAKLRKDLGLDQPYHQQYLLWLWQMVSLRPGDSIFTNEPIAVSLRKAIPVTLELAALAMIIGLVIAVPVGVLSASRQDKPADYAGRVVAVAGLSIPDFWLATLVITFAAIWVNWIPPIGYVSFWDSPWRNLQQFLLPAAILGYRLSSATMRMTRSTVLETLREDYVRTAWAKGLAGRIVVYKHALKNALIPVVTIVGGQLGTLLAGTFVVEQIFALPGMGRLTVEALRRTMKKKPLGAFSAALLVVIVLMAIFADVLAPYDPLETHPEIRLSAPSRAHPFGTDDIGRDVLSRIIYGARISLWVGLLAVGIGTAAGMVIASIWLGNAILIEATLSFLGVGTQPPTPSWGLMLSSTGRAFMEQAPWLAIFPGLAISLAVLGFNLFGDTLRDAWDPKLRRNG